MVDLKITELAALTVVNDEDLIAIVDDPTGTASTKKIRTDDFQSTWHVGARVYDAGNQTISNTTDTAVAFDSERWDTDTIHDTSTNNSKLTCNTAGKYLISGNIQWDGNSTGTRIVFIKLNGATVIAKSSTNITDASNFQMQCTTIYDLAVTNYVELFVRQSSGDDLAIELNANFTNEFMMQRIG